MSRAKHLVGSGIACVIAAIVGGGRKAFGIELEAENAKPKKLLAESELGKAALKDRLGRKW
ncbi:MAG: hypothetical protein ACJ8R9_31110 [Steroidobacteraceae bacterium]